jgi:uncharacterized membrane protein
VAEDVIAVTFHDDSKAYEALSELKDLHGRELINLTAAAVVVRQADGHITVKDETANNELPPMAAGGMIGLLIGIIGGPLGVLIGGASGLLAGALIESDEEGTTESALAEMSRSVRVDHETLLAQLYEPNPGEIDQKMGLLGGTVLRERAETVEAEVAAAEHAEHEAKKKARKELHEKRETQRKEDVHAKVEALKAKLHHHQGGGQKQAATNGDGAPAGTPAHDKTATTGAAS